MKNQILSLQTEPISQISGRNVLKAGSSVYVKVIADKGNGHYLGSVAGNRVNITSSRGLQVGSSFVATISSKNGVIYITPKDSNVLNGNLIHQSIESSPLQPAQLANILSSLGVTNTELSGTLLKMMMQTQMKVDGNVLKGIYSMALKHKGKEKAAGEIIALLKDKGIEAAQEEIEQLIAYLEDNNDENNDYSSAKNLVNRSNKIQSGWVIVPYNLVSTVPGDNDKGPVAAGVIRILFDKSDNLKKINLNCYCNTKEYIFSILFENKKCSKIKFNINPCESAEKKYEEKLSKYITDNKVEIEWSPANLIEGCGSEGEEIISIQGEA